MFEDKEKENFNKNFDIENTNAHESALADIIEPKNEENIGEMELSDPKADKTKKRKKKIITYLAFVLINALVIMGLLLFEDRTGDKVAGREAFYLLGKNWAFTFLFISMFFIILIGDTLVFYTLTKKMNIGNNTSLSLKTAILGRYYDRITPWSMGGEPFQVAYLISGGVKTGDSFAITMSRHIIRFFSVAIAVVAILISSRITTNIYVMVVAILSVFGGLIFPSFMLLCCFRPRIGLKIGRGIITLLYKMKIVKNYQKQLEKMEKEVSNFIRGLEYLSANKKVIIIITLVSLMELFAMNSVPFFVIKALGISDIFYWKTLVLCIFVNYASSFAPTPGGAGIAELSFYAIFASYITGNYLFWAVLFWRIAVFYMPVFVGFIVQVSDAIKRIKKA